jgi:hypothetical protein
VKAGKGGTTGRDGSGSKKKLHKALEEGNMAGIMRGHKTLKSQLDKFCGDLRAARDREKVSSDAAGFWQQKATELTSKR